MQITKVIPVKDANIVSSNVPENDYPVHLMTTNYLLGDYVITTGVDEHRVWLAVHGVTATYPLGNIGYNPLAELNLNAPVHWALQGATNKYKMFDSYVSSTTVQAESLEIVLTNMGNINTVSLQKCSGKEARLIITKPDLTVVTDITKSLISTAGRSNWWNYFTAPVLNKNTALFNDITPSYNATISITINNPGADCALGLLVIGNGIQFNLSERSENSVNRGAGVRNRDFSVKQLLSTGDYTFKQGETALDGNFEFAFPNSLFDLYVQTVINIGSAPCLITATNIYDATNIYGLIVDSDPRLDYASHTTARLKVEGLI